MVKNEDGYVKCLTKNGNVRWLGDHIATNKKRMATMGLTVAPSPIKLEPNIFEKEEDIEVDDAKAEKPKVPKTQKKQK